MARAVNAQKVVAPEHFVGIIGGGRNTKIGDSQPVHNVAATTIHPDVSGEKEETADREEDPMEFFDEQEVGVIGDQTAPDVSDDGFVQTVIYDADGSPDIVNQTARSALYVEDDQLEHVEAPSVPQVPNRGRVSQLSGEDLRSSNRDRPPRADRDRPPIPEWKDSLFHLRRSSERNL
ncbi:hypothetical protein R1sor_008775 [Riccia sorocarpa]|uniref:Uncharacterized protein n=1 Tax=Riccia sorocarpa TaxID=122646 RepID=A0ABD3HWI3_9MARC